MAFLDSGAGARPQGMAPPSAMNGAGAGLPALADTGALPAVDPAQMSLQPQLPAQMPPQRPISPIHQKLLDWADHNKTKNIAPELSEEELGKYGELVIRELAIDETSREEWLKKNEEALDLAMQVAKEKNYPWPKASNIIFPLITTASIQFAARAYPAIVAGRNVVKGVIYGSDNGEPQISPTDGTPMVKMGPQGPQPVWKMEPGAKRARADRVGEHMSYQLLELNEDWDADTDQLLHILPIAGCHFRKTYYDPVFRLNVSTMVSAKNVIINYRAKSMKRAPRISERLKFYPHEVTEKVAAGLFLDVELGLEPDANDDKDAPRTFIEQHRRLDLDGDGYSEPYVVTVHEASRKIVRITACYDADGVKVSKEKPDKIVSIDPVKYYTKFDFMPSMDGGIYGTGFGQLLNPINKGINTTLNMLLDAGHLQVAGGGFIGKGVSMHSGSVRVKPAEWRTLNTPGAAIRDALVPIPAPGPSVVLFQLLGLLIDAGKDMAASNDVLEGSPNMANMQPTTMLALIEQGLKVFTSIYKRIHRSLKQEFDKLYRLNRIYIGETEEYEYGGEWKTVSREDYLKGSGVCPYSDPDMVSDMQKMARAGYLLQFKDDPRCDGSKIILAALEAGAIPRPEDFMAQQPAPDPIVMATVAETEAKIATERAKQIHFLADSVWKLAQADAKEGDQNMGWITTQLAVLRTRMEMINGAPQPGQPQASQQPGGDDEGGGEDGADAPPMPGAKKAKDGNWYIADPERPNKFMMVGANAA